MRTVIAEKVSKYLLFKLNDPFPHIWDLVEVVIIASAIGLAVEAFVDD